MLNVLHFLEIWKKAIWLVGTLFVNKMASNPPMFISQDITTTDRESQ